MDEAKPVEGHQPAAGVFKDCREFTLVFGNSKRVRPATMLNTYSPLSLKMPVTLGALLRLVTHIANSNLIRVLVRRPLRKLEALVWQMLRFKCWPIPRISPHFLCAGAEC
jgi:hypothetical protein